MLLVVLFVSAVVLASPPTPAWSLRSPALILAVAGAAIALPLLTSALVTRRALYCFERYPADPGYGQGALSRGLTCTYFALAASQALLLLGTGWLDLCRRIPVVGTWVVLPDLIALAPFLATILLVWIITYPAERAVRQIALEMHLFRGKPIRPVWRLFEYLAFNLRHQVLFVMAPMLIILVARDMIDVFRVPLQRATRNVYAPDFLLGLATAVVAVVAPGFLRYIWITRRLPDSPLRARLEGLCRRLKLRCRDILVWHSGGMLVNAAVMGVLAPFRYVLITDGMLQQLDDRKIEAVFGHEAGHVKRHHILFFLLFALTSGCIVAVATARAPTLTTPASRQTLYLVVAAVLTVKWGYFFGLVSRSFERQADIFGVRTVALMEPPCALPCAVHGADPLARPSTDPSAQLAGGAGPGAARVADREILGGGRLCSGAAELFGDTLNQVAVLNGIPPEAPSWRHGSIASRSRALQRLARSPVAATRFERRLLIGKLVILAAAVAFSAWAAYEMKLWAAAATLLRWGRPAA
ncbi:MAG: Protease HtpX [Phycisphaerae bacterium]|nr:Protease HtpX [Phycisphaerae bacterium]